MKTIPIFWGGGNVKKYFDSRGIVSFWNTIECAHFASNLTLAPVSVDEYASMYKSVTKNFNRAKSYEVTEDWFYKNVLLPRG
jgi:hypothetical protein